VIACVPGAIPVEERSAHFALLTRIFRTMLLEQREIPNGYAYRFDASAFDDLTRWITNERRCCPFLAFAVELAPDDGPITVRLTGPEGTREFLDVEFGPAGPP